MKSLILRRLATLTLALSTAAAAFGSAAAAAPDPANAQALVEETTRRMQQTLQQNRAELEQDKSKINDYAREILVPNTDFDTISKLVLGRHWRGATAAQRTRFTDEFRELMVRTYAKALLEYIDAQVSYLPIKPSNRDNRVTVRSQVTLPDSGQKIPLDYTVCHNDQVWKVCNIVIDRTINFIVNYRQQIGSQVQRSGLDAVIDDLSRRNGSG